MNKPLISIIVPVYNAENYLQRTFDSLKFQTLKEIEIIFVNDASTDNSLSLLKKFQNEDHRVTVINLEKNLRQGGARNKGILAAKADYITFVDSDDIIENSLCQELYSQIDEITDIVVCQIEMNNGDRKIILQDLPDFNNLSDEERKIIIAFKFEPGPVAKLLRKSLILDNKLFFPEGISYEDAAIVPTWALLSRKVKYVENPLYKYIINSNSTTQIKSWSHFDRLKAMEYLYKIVESIKFNDLYTDILKAYIIYHGWECLLCNCITLVPRNPYPRIKEVRNRLKTLIGDDKIMYLKYRGHISLHRKILLFSYKKSIILGNITLGMMRFLNIVVNLIIR